MGWPSVVGCSEARDAIAFVDSHTEGEPTRVVLAGIPDAGGGTIRARAAWIAREHPGLRGAIVDEPRGYPALVGALLLPPSRPASTAAVAFINNAGQLPMCVHACIGIARTLAHLGVMPDRAWDRPLILETPAGDVGIQLEADGRVAVEGVPAYRSRRAVELSTRYGSIAADVAWGGNWFLIVERCPIPVAADNLEALTALGRELRAACDARGLRGDDGAEIDHVQLCGPSSIADARNFVLCPGGVHDRSPCGTGTSARMACLFADGRLQPGQRFVQEGIAGTCFTGTISAEGDGRVRPTVRGRAWVTGEGRLLFDPSDPLAAGRFPAAGAQPPGGP